MKKLILLFTLLAAGMAHSQTITEKDLLGEWHIVKINLDGIEADFETNTVTVTDPALEATPDDIEFVREMMAGPEGEEYRKGGLIFKPGFIVEMVEIGSTEAFSYKIINENGSQAFEIKPDGSTGVKIQIALKDGVLSLNQGGGGKNIFLKKKQ